MRRPHPSVSALLAADGTTDDPDIAIRRRARALVAEVMQRVGWDGPPFDQAELASYQGLNVEVTYSGFTDEQDACITPGSS